MYFALCLALLVLFTQVVSSVPTPVLTEMLWQFWTNYAPSFSIRQLKAKRDELMTIREERSKTSSQDEFAKWARLDREHQRLKKEYEAKNNEVAATRQRVTSVVRVLKWTVSKGLRWGVQWHFRKVPIVWLPHNALPYRVEWFLSLPSAPLGSVSTATWIFATDMAVSSTLNLVKRTSLRFKAAKSQ